MGYYTQAVALGMVGMGDGDLDLVAGNYGINRLYLNDGTGTPAHCQWDRHHRGLPQHICRGAGDVDGDGDLDLVAGNSEANRLYLERWGGYPGTVSGTNITTDSHYTYAVALGDVGWGR